ncbi:MAG: hypothetical protein OXL41_13330 [Nitrospinae bacterium]|nr:hypothetical protein [Nitrospinota bacterium]
MLKLDWGDAQVWMDTAEILYLRNAENPRGSLPRADYPGTNELNVANVCAGYAFELLFKVLVRAGGMQPEPVHEPSAAYEHLKQEDKDAVDRIILKHRWNDSGEFLTYLDKVLCDRDRKYWGRTPKGGNAKTVFSFGEQKCMDALKRLHKELSDFAIKRIEDNPDVYEDWPGIGQRL